MRQKRDTVEEDLMAGPLLQKETYYQDFSDRNLNSATSKSRADETHILISVYRHRIVVGQFDTTEQVWDVVGDSFHSIEVLTPRTSVEKALKVKSDSDIVKAIEEGFPGPRTIDKWIAFCRENVCNMTIEETGPVKDDLIKTFMDEK